MIHKIEFTVYGLNKKSLIEEAEREAEAFFEEQGTILYYFDSVRAYTMSKRGVVEAWTANVRAETLYES